MENRQQPRRPTNLKVKTVLKTGGEYKPEHVFRIKNMLEKYIKAKYEFICLTDDSSLLNNTNITTRKLVHNWPSWWSKIELFKDIEESFYIDLDMTINGDITDIATCETDFLSLRNLAPSISGIGSAIMRWSGDKTFIYNTFKKQPEHYMKINNKRGTNKWGDQSFIWEIMDGKIEFLQDRFPNRIGRFRVPNKDINIFYGRKRPW